MPNLNFNGNYVDLIIIAILLYFFAESLRHGFFVFVSDLISFGAALILSSLLFKYPAEILKNNFSLPDSFANVIGFIVLAAFIEMTGGYILAHLISKIPEDKWKSWPNRFLGIIPGLIEGVLIVLFFVTVAMAVPLKPQIQYDIENSQIGKEMLKRGSFMKEAVDKVFGGLIEDSIAYLTVKPGSDERIPIEVSRLNPKTDDESEKAMFDMVNSEREKNGLKKLAWSDDLSKVGENHATDMWKRSYFGHVSPDGKDVSDRVDDANIRYYFVAENLAKAPNVKIAHEGLMQSEGHRANILDKRLGKIGIGVIDNGRDGKMFVQVFTN